MPTASEDMLKSPPSGLTPATVYVHPPCTKLITQCASILYEQPLWPRAGNSALVAMPSPFTGAPLEWQTAITVVYRHWDPVQVGLHLGNAAGSVPLLPRAC